jgi:hypothetical protein
MDGVTRDDHIGATLRSVLGSAAKQFEMAFEWVFSSGTPLLGYEISARLLTRTDEGQWITSCFTVKYIVSCRNCIVNYSTEKPGEVVPQVVG